MKLSFKSNLGLTDRIIRTVLGLAFFGLAVFKTVPQGSLWSTVFWAASGFLLLEAALGY